MIKPKSPIHKSCLFVYKLFGMKNQPETNKTTPSKSNKCQTQTCYILSILLDCEFILAPWAPFLAQLAQSSPKDGVPGAHNKPPISQRKTQKVQQTSNHLKKETWRFFLIMSVHALYPFLEGISPSLKIIKSCGSVRLKGVLPYQPRDYNGWLWPNESSESPPAKGSVRGPTLPADLKDDRRCSPVFPLAL